MNNSVLKDQQYLQGVHESIDNTLRQYQDIKSYQLMWEILKINVKEYTIHYCVNRKKDNNYKIKCIQNGLDKLSEDILFLETKGKLTKVEEELLLSHKTKMLELESKRNTFFEEKAKGYCIRSRAGLRRERCVLNIFLALKNKDSLKM